MINLDRSSVESATITLPAIVFKLLGQINYNAQRKISADLDTAIVQNPRRWKTGNAPQQSSRADLEALAKTGEPIASHRGDVTSEHEAAVDKRASFWAKQSKWLKYIKFN